MTKSTSSKGALIGGGIAVVLVAWAANKLYQQGRTAIADGVPVDEVVHTLPKAFTNPFAVSFEQPDLIAAAVAAGIVALIVLYSLTTKKQMRAGEEHGSARWGTPADIRPFTDRNRARNLLFTKTERLALDSRKTQRNLHALVIGSSGSGKTRYYVQPNIAQCNQSVVVTDPNGEIMQATGQQLEDAGYAVRSLNFVDWAQSDTFNPLAYFTPSQGEVDVLILVENIIANTTGRRPSGGDNSFWEKAERALLAALVAFVYGRDGDKATMNDVTELLSDLETSENDESFQSVGDALFLSLGDILDEHPTHVREAHPERYDEDALLMLRMWEFAFAQYDIYSKGAGETKKSVLISLGVRLAPLYMSPLKRVLGSNTVDAASVGQRPTALFLIMPDSHTTFSWLLAVFYDLFFQKNIALADASPKKRLPVPVHCFMDEFANIGKLPSFHTKIAVMRKRGLAVSVIIQNYEQGKALYKDDWETVVGNCDSVLFLGGREKSTTQWISQQLGKATIDSRDESRQLGGRSGGGSHNFRKLGRELLLPDEVAKLGSLECLYLLRGVPPFRSRKLDAISEGDYVYTPQPVPETEAPAPAEADAGAEPREFDENDVELVPEAA
ncbi:VirD4-like conjugal transfer protein, CD1115 family [Gulosibacter hominis]|uniref:VirD4-like conjugal transfer protein, CD1115 family n=1 Tax=Gulosibacter hominis TaxID=2770504 RepID=UPI0019181D06|nr:type IV secretory system conjugative DNA transfer family protein [Gulosibacter hominis]